LSLTVPILSQSGQPFAADFLAVRWFRPRPQSLVLRTVQMRVSVVDPELEEAPSPEAVPSPERTTLVPEVSDVPVAPPLAIRPVEDPDWVMHN
jgi:hypothetical protein